MHIWNITESTGQIYKKFDSINYQERCGINYLNYLFRFHRHYRQTRL